MKQDVSPGAALARLPAVSVDRRSAIPFYFQLKRLLEDEIRSGRWAPGVQVPSEPVLREHFDISRTTIRQALSELEQEGLIRRERGRGTFVADPGPRNWVVQSAASFHEEAAATGVTVRSEVLRREVAPLPEWAAQRFGLASGVDGVHLARRRWLDRDLVMYVENFLPAEHADAVLAADLEHGSLYTALRRAGVEIGGGRRIVEAAPATEKIAELLEVEAGAPVLFVDALTWDEENRPFECYEAWHRSERSHVEVRVVPEAIASELTGSARGTGGRR